MATKQPDFQAELDAHTLVAAEEVAQDPQRLKAAKVQAGKTAKALAKTAKAASTVAKPTKRRPAKVPKPAKSEATRAPMRRSGRGR